MNIFILDSDIDKCAAAYVTKHIGKMQLELAQLLSTYIHHLYNRTPQPPFVNEFVKDKLYKSTHFNHPCSKWIRFDWRGFVYTSGLLWALSKEYFKRTGKHHKSFLQMVDAGATSEQYYNQAKELNIELLNPAKAMPDEYKTDSVVESYRNYYNLGKKHLHDWKNATVPEWIQKCQQ